MANESYRVCKVLQDSGVGLGTVGFSRGPGLAMIQVLTSCLLARWAPASQAAAGSPFVRRSWARWWRSIPPDVLTSGNSPSADALRAGAQKAMERHKTSDGGGPGTFAITLLLSLVGLSVPQGAQAQATIDICDRTPQVEAEILRAVVRNDFVSNTELDCSNVTPAELAEIRVLALNDDDDDGSPIALKDGDFDDLTGLEWLDLGHSVSSLPSGVFSDLTSLEELSLDYNNSRSASPWAMFAWLVQIDIYSLSSASTWAMFAWLVQTDTYSFEFGQHLGYSPLVGSDKHLLFEFGKHLGYVRLVGSDRHLLFEFGQHLGYIPLVGSDRHLLFEFGQHLGYVRLVGSDRHLLFEFGQHLGYVRLVGSDRHLLFEFGKHLGYVRLVGSDRHLLFEFGQHLGYVRLVGSDTYSLSLASTWDMFCLVGSDTYSLSLASTWAMFDWLVQTFTL